MAEEEKQPTAEESGESPLKRRRRLIVMLFLCMLFTLSLLSVILFFIKVDLKGALGDEPEALPVVSEDLGIEHYTPPLAESPTSNDLYAARRKHLLEELTLLKSQMRYQEEFAGDGDILWMYDATTPKGMQSEVFYIYLGRQDRNVWGRIHAGYTQNHPVYMKRIIVNVDGTLYNIPVDYNDRKEEKREHLDAVFEYVDIPMATHLDTLLHIANGHKVFVFFRGENRQHGFQLTNDQIAAVRRILRVYRIYEELRQDPKPMP